MKYVAINIISLIMVAFFGFSIAGMTLSKPDEPLVKLAPCYNGTMVALSFNSFSKFLYEKVEFGPTWSRYRIYMIAWPGGTAGITLTDMDLCPDDPQEKIDVQVFYRFLKRPDLFKGDEENSRELHLEDTEDNCIVEQ